MHYICTRQCTRIHSVVYSRTVCSRRRRRRLCNYIIRDAPTSSPPPPAQTTAVDAFVVSVNSHLTDRQKNERIKGIMARIESYDVVVRVCIQFASIY